jgi:diguanylate cyclase (GGDEF)-like protein
MCEVIRDSDLLARYGGDEFALIAPQTELEGALALAEKLRSGVAEAQPPAAEGTVRVTVSVGIAMLGKDGRTLFDDADRALYHAKKSGKDCVYWSTEGGCWDQPGSRKERRRRDG